MSHCVGPDVDCPFATCYKSVEYEKDLSRFVGRFDGQPLHEMCPSFVILRRPFSHFYFSERFDYWVCDCDFEFCLGLHVPGIIGGWQNGELLVIPPSHKPSQYIKTPSWWRELEVSRLLGTPTPPVFAHYSG